MGAREAIAELEWEDRQAAGSAPSPEQRLFEEEVAAGLPTGDDLTGAELRCDYLLERCAAERTRLDKLEEFCARRIQMIHEYKTAEATKIEKRLAWLEGRIREHMPFDAASFKKHYGQKSHRLPHGLVGYRKHPASIAIVDPRKALAFAKAAGLEVKVTESVNKTPLMEWVEKNGELPDPEQHGFELHDARDEFYVTPDLEFA